MPSTVMHMVLMTDPETGETYRCHQVGHDHDDVVRRVERAVDPESGNMFAGMHPVIDPFAVSSN
jgi:hypothetical protein